MHRQMWHKNDNNPGYHKQKTMKLLCQFESSTDMQMYLQNSGWVPNSENKQEDLQKGRII